MLMRRRARFIPEYIVRGEDIMVKFTALQRAKVSDPKVPKYQSDTLELGILECLRNNASAKQTEIAAITGASLPSIKRHMKTMVEQSKIERVGGKRYGYWKIHDEMS